jgi:hypothetical protein
VLSLCLRGIWLLRQLEIDWWLYGLRAMLEEAIRGEKAAIDEYNDVLEDTTLPPSTQRVLLEQKNKISNGLATIKGLEDLR